MIKVTDVLAWRFAEAALDRGSTTNILSHVYLHPDGWVVGTDSYSLAAHPAAVEPFEGPPVLVKLDKPLPASALKRVGSSELIIYPETGTATCDSWRSMAQIVTDFQYPNFKLGLPKGPLDLSVGFLGMNMALYTRFTKVANEAKLPKERSGPGWGVWEFAMAFDKVAMTLLTNDPRQTVICMPLTLKGSQKVLSGLSELDLYEMSQDMHEEPAAKAE